VMNMRCEAYQCTMDERVCVARQQSRKYAYCLVCAQGREVVKRMNKKDKMDVVDGMNGVSKVCPVCGELKPLGDFYRNRAKKDGHSSYCKVCFRARKGKKTEQKTHPQPPSTRSGQALPGGELKAQTVVVDFEGYPELLALVEARAKAEFRSVEGQVLFLVSQGQGE